MTNKEFANKDVLFRKRCEFALINFKNKPSPLFPSKRQASKYRNGKGLAFQVRLDPTTLDGETYNEYVRQLKDKKHG